jgi:hypothetical protein
VILPNNWFEVGVVVRSAKVKLGGRLCRMSSML